MKRLALLLGGPLLTTEALKERLSGYRLLAADSGARHALALGLPLELWLGDFDSSPPWLREALPAPKETLPREKDQTDGEALVRRALELGAEEALLLGALGGRLDHTLAHLELAFHLAERGVRVELTDGLTQAFPLLLGPHAFPLAKGRSFSLLPFPEATLALEGARWNLPPTPLKATTLTLENQALGPIRVWVEGGRAVLYLF
ncbi:thiamine diphosphokinase [Thermus thermamylovorans]|uniref:Thiamine diphosphokinase n=1 Tax=Thermus thermamylovorans TaxID=2509362 RepID=A0A4Q9AYV7_9DEIN|nr:thiamine diphosphokinase [Thermus thermamylovorans]TBH17239.1 thiamine diphosphokinase [Thermus thermamylovorans]